MMSGEPHEVKKALQPPLSGGSFLVRRDTSVCQSIACRSTLKPAASSCGLATVARLVVAGDVGLVQQHDRRAVVARLLQELLGLGDVAARPCPPSPWSISSGEPQGNSDLHTRVVARDRRHWPRGTASGRARRARPARILGLSNGLCSTLKRRIVLAARLVDRHDLDVLVLLQQRQQVGRHGLDQVDLAVEQRVHLGLRVGDRDPFDPVDLGHLAAGEARGRLAARLVFRVLDVDRLLARLPLVLLEDERAGADGVGDLRVGIGARRRAWAS